MKSKSEFAALAKAIGAENVRGTSAKNTPAGGYKFVAMGEKSTLGEGKDRRTWLPVLLENVETGELTTLSCKSVMTSPGLKYPSAIGAERIASIAQACEDQLEVTINEVEPIEVEPREGQTFKAYTRHVIHFDPVDMPTPQYAAEGE